MKRLLRRIWWVVIRRHVLEKIGTLPLAGYPLLLWVELGGGKGVYFSHGAGAFVAELERRGSEILDRLEEATTPDELRPIEKRKRSITSSIAQMQGLRAEREEEYRVKMALIDEMERNLIPR